MAGLRLLGALVTIPIAAAIYGSGASRSVLAATTLQQATCLTSGVAVNVTLSYLKRLVSDTDSVTARGRQLFDIPQVPDSAVALVSDTTACRRAADAYGRNLVPPDTAPDHTMLVVTVGPTRYVVADPRDTAGEFAVHMVFDTSFSTVLAQFAK